MLLFFHSQHNNITKNMNMEEINPKKMVRIAFPTVREFGFFTLENRQWVSKKKTQKTKQTVSNNTTKLFVKQPNCVICVEFGMKSILGCYLRGTLKNISLEQFLNQKTL